MYGKKRCKTPNWPKIVKKNTHKHAESSYNGEQKLLDLRMFVSHVCVFVFFNAKGMEKLSLKHRLSRNYFLYASWNETKRNERSEAIGKKLLK